MKMQNYVSGSSRVIRVEMQNADVSVRDEKVVGSLHGDSGTMLILLSDDDTGYMPYRIDNFSKEVSILFSFLSSKYLFTKIVRILFEVKFVFRFLQLFGSTVRT